VLAARQGQAVLRVRAVPLAQDAPPVLAVQQGQGELPVLAAPLALDVLLSSALPQFEPAPWFQGVQPAWWRESPDEQLPPVLYAREPSTAWPRQPLRACHGWR